MFDIGFSEIVVIGVVALVVIGPERLPKTARTLGHLFGRLQRYVNDVKADISREMELDELRRLRQEVHGAANELRQSVTSAVGQVETSVHSIEQELNAAARDAGASAAADPATPQGFVATEHPDASHPVFPPSDAQPPAGDGTPGGDAAAAAPAAGPARQSSLPGFDKI
jgi:sec-independent protein translocase protein TatB